jgi:hypothetical protein
MPEKSGIDAALCVPLPAGPAVRSTVCPQAGVIAAAANVTDKNKTRCRCMAPPSPREDFVTLSRDVRTLPQFPFPKKGTATAAYGREGEQLIEEGGDDPRRHEDERCQMAHMPFGLVRVESVATSVGLRLLLANSSLAVL